MKHLAGIGGIFFQAEDPEKLNEWYKTNLGIDGTFHWKDVTSLSSHYTVWNTFLKSSEIFKGTEKDYVINYEVSDLDILLQELKSNGVSTTGNIDEGKDGRFASVLDPDGNKIILWEASGKTIHESPANPDRVTGLGGVFFKSENPATLNEWYSKHLGFQITEWGCSFEWIDPHNPAAKAPAQTAWSIFKAESNYFSPSEKQFMFNYRVKNLAALLKALEAQGVEMAGAMQEFSYGRFGWIVDPEQNKIELWEPIDDGF
ncbi:MAG: VOC family protein [Bacteroidota bacterium]